MQRVHFIGIGGVGMNGLAQLAAQSGYAVTGSDRIYDAEKTESTLSEVLMNLGIQLFPQNGSGVDRTTTQVVCSTAIEPDNPDIQRANQLGIPLLHRADFLKELVDDAELIAIAGTAGKTTTTGLLGWIFECLEKNPTVYNGAAVLNWKNPEGPGNIRKGNPNLWIIEVDESDKSFLKFHPTHSIITNISKDHYELDELHLMFDQFRSQTSGSIIEGASGVRPGNSVNSFVFQNLEFTVPMLGKHNLENAFCAVQLCAALGLDLAKVREAIVQFKGIERRLEVAGKVNDITFYDDYAHNPAKIKAALSAVSDSHEHVHAFWRPHGFTPLNQFQNELIDIFASQPPLFDTLFILPVYFAGGTVERNITSAEFVDRLKSAGVHAIYVADYSVLQHELKQCTKPNDAVLGMGARDPELPLFAKRLVSEWMNI